MAAMWPAVDVGVAERHILALAGTHKQPSVVGPEVRMPAAGNRGSSPCKRRSLPASHDAAAWDEATSPAPTGLIARTLAAAPPPVLDGHARWQRAALDAARCRQRLLRHHLHDFAAIALQVQRSFLFPNGIAACRDFVAFTAERTVLDAPFAAVAETADVDEEIAVVPELPSPLRPVSRLDSGLNSTPRSRSAVAWASPPPECPPRTGCPLPGPRPRRWRPPATGAGPAAHPRPGVAAPPRAR